MGRLSARSNPTGLKEVDRSRVFISTSDIAGRRCFTLDRLDLKDTGLPGTLKVIVVAQAGNTFGDMTEQLASRQAIAHNRGFFQTAHELYIKDGKLKRGASSKPKKPKERKPGDRTGMGSVRRLAIALQRLDLTYDTEVMESPQMRMVLPKEFSKWSSGMPGS